MAEEKGLFANLGYAIANGMGIGGILAIGGNYFFQGIQDMLGFPIVAPDGVAKFLFGVGVFMGIVMEYRKWFKRNKQ